MKKSKEGISIQSNDLNRLYYILFSIYTFFFFSMTAGPIVSFLSVFLFDNVLAWINFLIFALISSVFSLVSMYMFLLYKKKIGLHTSTIETNRIKKMRRILIQILLFPLIYNSIILPIALFSLSYFIINNFLNIPKLIVSIIVITVSIIIISLFIWNLYIKSSYVKITRIMSARIRQ